MSGVYGIQKPILKYGSSYGSTWNLNGLAEGEGVFYEPDDKIETKFFTSDLTLKTTAINPVAGKRRLACKLVFTNLGTTNAGKLRSILLEDTVRMTLHADNSATEFDYNIKKSKWFGLELPYPQYQSAIIWLESIDVETLPAI